MWSCALIQFLLTLAQVDGQPHKWSFVRDGEEKGIIECAVDASSGLENVKADLKVGMKDLLGESSRSSLAAGS